MTDGASACADATNAIALSMPVGGPVALLDPEGVDSGSGNGGGAGIDPAMRLRLLTPCGMEPRWLRIGNDFSAAFGPPFLPNHLLVLLRCRTCWLGCSNVVRLYVGLGQRFHWIGRSWRQLLGWEKWLVEHFVFSEPLL